MVGDHKAGKTCLIKRFCEDKVTLAFSMSAAIIIVLYFSSNLI